MTTNKKSGPGGGHEMMDEMDSICEPFMDTSKTSVQIADLEKIAKTRNQQAIIAYCVERDGTIRCVTWGEDKLKCEAAGWWGQGLFKANVFAKVPFWTIFGWGNNGRPVPLDAKERLQIMPAIESGAIPRNLAFPKDKLNG